jgi:glutathionyl-hydroquinone reductase
LLKEVDQYEKDFKEMFAYLDDVEDMLHGEDVNTIKEMIDISDVRMKGHIS